MTFSSHGKEDDISNNRTWMTISIIERGRGGGRKRRSEVNGIIWKWQQRMNLSKKGNWNVEMKGGRNEDIDSFFVVFCSFELSSSIYGLVWIIIEFVYLLLSFFLSFFLNSWDDIYPTPSLISWYRPRVCNDYLLFVTMPIAKKSRLFFNISHHITHDYIFLKNNELKWKEIRREGRIMWGRWRSRVAWPSQLPSRLNLGSKTESNQINNQKKCVVVVGYLKECSKRFRFIKKKKNE